jgi:peptidoglycan/xylan/chitin deacetylase (PgdA/CDA1 family)
VSWLEGRAAGAMVTVEVGGTARALAFDPCYADNAMVMSVEEFGLDVGLPRLLELLADVAVPATFFVSGAAALQRPALVGQLLDAGHEVAHHGYDQRPPTHLSDAEEREDFERGLDVLRRLGATVHGHRAPLKSPSLRSAALAAEHGLAYDSSLFDDDRPYVLETVAGDLVELPPAWELDDWVQFAFDPASSESHGAKAAGAVADGWQLALDGARMDSGLFVLSLHPAVAGRGSRIAALRVLLERATRRGDVAFLTGEQAATRAAGDPDLPRRALERLDPRPDPAVFPVA